MYLSYVNWHTKKFADKLSKMRCIIKLNKTRLWNILKNYFGSRRVRKKSIPIINRRLIYSTCLEYYFVIFVKTKMIICHRGRTNFYLPLFSLLWQTLKSWNKQDSGLSSVSIVTSLRRYLWELKQKRIGTRLKIIRPLESHRCGPLLLHEGSDTKKKIRFFADKFQILQRASRNAKLGRRIVRLYALFYEYEQ